MLSNTAYNTRFTYHNVFGSLSMWNLQLTWCKTCAQNDWVSTQNVWARIVYASIYRLKTLTCQRQVKNWRKLGYVNIRLLKSIIKMKKSNFGKRQKSINLVGFRLQYLPYFQTDFIVFFLLSGQFFQVTNKLSSLGSNISVMPRDQRKFSEFSKVGNGGSYWLYPNQWTQKKQAAYAHCREK